MTSTKLDPDAHLVLEQPLLRLPHELLRKNLKSAQRQIESTNKGITSSLASDPKKPADALASLDATLAKAQNLKRKLEALHSEEKQLHRQQKARIDHLQSLHEVQSLADVKYDSWAHHRLDRLLVDYLLRQGYTASARQLASEKHVEDLTDVPVFEECGRIEQSLRTGRVQEALSWCGENKQALKKTDSKLELELRLQQFIEMVREGDMGKLMEAIAHARKHLAGGTGQDVEFGLRAGGLLAHPPDTLIEPYYVSLASCLSNCYLVLALTVALVLVDVRQGSLQPSRSVIPQDTPRLAIPPFPTTSPYCALRRSLGA